MTKTKTLKIVALSCFICVFTFFLFAFSVSASPIGDLGSNGNIEYRCVNRYPVISNEITCPVIYGYTFYPLVGSNTEYKEYTIFYFSASQFVQYEQIFIASNKSLVDFLGIDVALDDEYSYLHYAFNNGASNLTTILYNLNNYGYYVREKYRLQQTNDGLTAENSRLDVVNGELMTQVDKLTRERNRLQGENLEYYTNWRNAQAENERLLQVNGEAYQNGYNEGMNEAQMFERGLMAVFSSPMYIFGEMFSFEIFGINALFIIQLLLTLAIVGFVIKKIRG